MTRADLIVSPKPTDEELAAIVAALESLRTQAIESVEVTEPAVSKWRRVAREESMRGDS